MNKLSIKKTILVFISMLFLAVFSATLILPQEFNHAWAMNSQETEMIENSALQSTYELYDMFKAPEGELLIDGQAQKADTCEVTSPTGKVANGFEEFSINEYGKFTVKYSKIVEGTEYYSIKEFFVYKDAYRSDSVRSSYEYVEQIEKSDKKESGLHLKVAWNRGFYFEKPIPVSTLTGRGDFITFYPYIDEYYKNYSELVGTFPNKDNPDRGATVAATRPFELYFKLTDSEDPNNYIVVTYLLFSSNNLLNGKVYACYHRAFANSQRPRGWTQSDTAVNGNNTLAVEYNDERYYIWTNDNYGTSAFNHGPTTKNRPCTFGFNATTTEVRVSENSSKMKSERLINVLNNYDLYRDNLFEGFKGDDVYLSIWAQGGSTVYPYMEFDITQIGPYTGADLQSTKVIDEKAPKIEVDFALDSVNVAKDAKFYPPTFEASDESGIAKKEIKVYRLTGNQKTYVDTVEDYFVPTELGEYYLEYYAQDIFGNYSTKTIKLNSKFNNGRGIAFSSTKLLGATFGERVAIPSYSISSLNNAKVDISIKSPKGDIKIDSDNTFIPNCLGTYTINYHYYDEIYSHSFSYQFEVGKSDNYIIYEEPLYDSYYVNNKKHALDKVYVNLAKDAEELKEAVTYAFEDGVTELARAKKVENGKDYLCTAKNKVQFKVVYNDGATDHILYESEEIPVMNVYEGDKFKLENYFAVENCKVKVDHAKTVLKIDDNESTARVDFNGNVLLSNFSVNFQIPTGKANYETLTIRVSDFYDETNYFDVIYTVYNGYYFCQLNDYFVKSNIYEFTNSTYEVTYANGIVSMLNHDKISYNYVPDFTRDRAKLSIIVDGITDDSEIVINSINKVALSLNTTDKNVKPELGVLSLPTYVNKGEKVTIPFVEVSDLLNPTINDRIELTIIAPDTSALLVGFVMTEDYTLECNQLGDYDIRLTLYTQSVKYEEYSYYVQCKNMTPSEITLIDQEEGGEVIYTTNGMEVNVADYSLADSNSTVIVYCIDTRNNFERVIDGKIMLDDVGTYKIIYCVDTVVGIFDIVEYTIKVVR